jgi:uncharacterized membrane protein
MGHDSSANRPPVALSEPDVNASATTAPAAALDGRAGVHPFAGSTPPGIAVVAVIALLSCLVALAGPPAGTLLADPHWQWVRVPLGIVGILILPGYALGLAFFPRFDDLLGLERMGLSTGLSLAQCPLLALALDRSPWGLSPTAIILSFGALTFGWCLVALARWLTRAGPQHPVADRPTLPSSWRRSSLQGVAGLLGVGVIMLAAGSVYALLMQPAQPPLTEFYMLGPEGLSQDYPSQAGIGQPISVSLAVHNLEGEPIEYRVVATNADQLSLGELPAFVVQPGQTWSGSLSFAINRYGFGQRIEIGLFRAADTQPYRQLSLVIDVPQPGVPTPVRLVATPVPTFVRPEPTLVQNPAVPTPPVRLIGTPVASE